MKTVTIFKATIQLGEPFLLLGWAEHFRAISFAKGFHPSRMIRVVMRQKNQIETPFSQHVHDWASFAWVHDSPRPVFCFQKPDIIV